MKRWSAISLVASMALLALLLASSSGATPIGPTCGTCQGSIYDLTYGASPVATTATSETYRITYTIDTSGYTGNGMYLDTVGFKVASSFLDATLVSAPVGEWDQMTGGLNGAGCSGSGSGYDCVAFNRNRGSGLDGAPLVRAATPYVWVFDVEVLTGALLFVGTDQASIKARYVLQNGFKSGALVSENITMSPLSSPAVPEPGAVAIFSIGLLVAGGLITRLNKD